MGKIKDLCNVKENSTNYPNISSVSPDNDISGKFLVKFKHSNNFFLNDPLPATIEPYKSRLFIQWENGCWCVTEASNVDIYELKHI